MASGFLVCFCDVVSVVCFWTKNRKANKEMKPEKWNRKRGNFYLFRVFWFAGFLALCGSRFSGAVIYLISQSNSKTEYETKTFLGARIKNCKHKPRKTTCTTKRETRNVPFLLLLYTTMGAPAGAITTSCWVPGLVFFLFGRISAFSCNFRPRPAIADDSIQTRALSNFIRTTCCWDS